MLTNTIFYQCAQSLYLNRFWNVNCLYYISYAPGSPLQQWASLYQPLTYNCDSSPAESTDYFRNKLDPTLAFKGKSKTPTPKKKQSAQCSSGATIKPQGNTGKHSGAKRWTSVYPTERLQEALFSVGPESAWLSLEFSAIKENFVYHKEKHDVECCWLKTHSVMYFILKKNSV